MGSIISSSMEPIIEKQKEMAIKQRLVDIKLQKRKRDFKLAMEMAKLRDRVYWMVAFYATMGSVSAVRMIYLRQFAPLPLNTVPYVLVPFIIGYQWDYAWGNKANRIYNEAQKILNDETHRDLWFNRPLRLPELLKEHYYKMENENTEKLREMGKDAEKPWAE